VIIGRTSILAARKPQVLNEIKQRSNARSGERECGTPEPSGVDLEQN
jgi:hypothetical protein